MGEAGGSDDAGGGRRARGPSVRAIAEPIGDDVEGNVRAGAARVFRGSTDRAHHELRDDAVEPAPLVPVPLVREAQLLEVLRRLRGDVLLELHRDATELRGVAVPADLHVEPHLGVRGVDLERGRVAHGLVDDLEDVFGGGLTGAHGGGGEIEQTVAGGGRRGAPLDNAKSARVERRHASICSSRLGLRS